MENNVDAGRSARPDARSRARVLREVGARSGVTTAELVSATGLHENTVRGHLERLLADGRIRREQAPAAGRGRPAQLWSAVADEVRYPYAGLAETLAVALSRTGDAPRIAREAAVGWGERIAAERGAGAPPSEPTPADTRALLAAVMREQGFAPDIEGDGITLRSCPLRAVASAHPETVCSAHAGLLDGVVRASGSSDRVELEPFTTPETCALRLLASS